MPWLVLLLFVLRPWAPPDARAVALARDACDRNRAGNAAVRTLTCRCTEAWLDRTPNPDDPDDFDEPIGTWDYWLAGKTVRVRGVGPEASDDTVWQDGSPGSPWRMMRVSTDADGTPILRITPWQFPTFRGDARSACLFMIWDVADLYGSGRRDLAGLLDRAGELRAARRVSEDGAELLYLDLGLPERQLRVWLDPARNYLVWKAVVITARPPRTDEYRVTDFRRAADGAIVPVRVEHRMSAPGARPATLVTTLSDVRINEPIPPEQFRLPGLAGLKCMDAVRSAVYRVDENGEWAGPWEPDREEDGRRESARRALTFVLVGLATVALAAAGAAIYWRRKRRARKTTAESSAPPDGDGIG